MLKPYAIALALLATHSGFALATERPTDLPTEVRAKIISRAATAKHKMLSTSPSVPDGKDDPGSMPIRNAQIKVTVRKFSLTKLSDGSFGYNVEDVCTKSSPFYVFDGRESKPTRINGQYVDVIQCNANLDNTPVVLHVAGYVILFHDAVFGDEKPVDVKGTFAWMYANKPDDESSIGLIDSYSATREMGKTSTIGMLSPPNDCSENGNCRSAVKEYFAAMFEVTDTP